MSIVSPKLSNLKILIIFTIYSYFFLTNPCFSWDGYDYEDEAQIEISSGNLVREGEIIQFYDWKKDQMHNGEVKLVLGSFSGARLEIYDLDEKRNRAFEMNGE